MPCASSVQAFRVPTQQATLCTIANAELKSLEYLLVVSTKFYISEQLSYNNEHQTLTKKQVFHSCEAEIKTCHLLLNAFTTKLLENNSPSTNLLLKNFQDSLIKSSQLAIKIFAPATRLVVTYCGISGQSYLYFGRGECD